jgi:hypothetical protein
VDRYSYLEQPGSKEIAPGPGPVAVRAILGTPSTVGQPETISPELRKRLLQGGRLLWVGVAVLTLGLFIASIGPRYEQFAHPAAPVRHALGLLNLSVGAYAAYNIALELLLAVVFSVVALVIYWRKSQDGVALVVAYMLLLAGSAMRPIVSTMEALLAVQPAWEMPINVLTYLTWFHIVAFFCIFPDGHFTPRWTRWLLLSAGALLIPWDLFPRSPLSPWMWPAPAFVALELALWGSCLYAQIYRYRHLSNRVQRQQTKWVVYGASTTLIVGLGFYLPRTLDPALNQPGTAATLFYDLATLTGMYLAVLMTPLAIGISILRYRLWGIDVLINRTLVYVPLTAILAGVYSASIALFQKVFLAFTGDKSDAAIVITTLILATLFTPVKNSLQSLVDKRFKEAPDPARVLKALNEQIEEDIAIVDPHRASRRLLEESAQAFEAESGAVYLEPDHTTPIYMVGKWIGNAELTIPLESGGATLGRLVLGPRPHGLEYSPQDRANLQATADLVATAIAQGAAEFESLPVPQL